jgi:hypothetical protein
MKDDEEITAEEAAKILGVSATNVRWYHRRGLLPGRRRQLLPGRRIGGLVLMFRRSDVEAFEKPKKTGRPHKESAAPKKPSDGKPAKKQKKGGA